MSDSSASSISFYRIPADISWMSHPHCREMIELMTEAFGPYHSLFSHFIECVAIPLQASFVAVDEAKDRVVAALQAVPYLYAEPSDAPPVAYLYALVTDSSRRGEGLMSSLLTFALKSRQEEWGRCEAILIPANEDLIPYYNKRGFRLLDTMWQKKADTSFFNPDALLPHPLVRQYQEWEERQPLPDDLPEQHAPFPYPMFLPDSHTDLARIPLLQNPLL